MNKREAKREALTIYGQHVYPCPMGGDWIGSVSVVPKDAVCNCGLEAALSAVERSLEQKEG